MKGLPRLCERLSLELQQAIDRLCLLSKEDYLPAASAQIGFVNEQIVRSSGVIKDIEATLQREAEKKASKTDGDGINVVTEPTLEPVAKKPGE